MSSAGQPSVPLRPSVFLSYSSEDRTAARMLRDALAAAGLEVWYDEKELAGGDAWDRKIRRQIRDCDYFMPVISASTERRKEGYFRREWRLASERTMDMADDVLFLLPVVIDDTGEASARVPDKFVAVQWTRAPGGESTPALAALTARLLAGEHRAASRPLFGGRPATADGPPPMPRFPHHPASAGHWPRFFAEIHWWILTAGWLLFNRLPRYFRIILVVWAIVTLFGMCRYTTGRKPPRANPPPAKSSPVDKDAKQARKAVAAEGAAALPPKGK